MNDQDQPAEKLIVTSNGIKQVLEALLFVASKPFRAKDFAKILDMEEPAVKLALESLVSDRKESGIILLENNGEYQLSTNSKCSTQVKNFLNAELREKLTDATVEVLAIIAYRQPISKAEIEAIRGVNSQYSLRHLLMRGLIEKVTNPSDARSFLYQSTTEFLMHLGLNSVNDLPEFAKLVEHIKLPETPGLNQQPSTSEAENTASTEQTNLAPQVEIQLTAEEPIETEEQSDEEEDEDEDDEE
jgi:segregation and condensation protein B